MSKQKWLTEILFLPYLENITHSLTYYDTIYTIANYSGFYSNLKDTIWATGGHFECSFTDEETF